MEITNYDPTQLPLITKLFAKAFHKNLNPDFWTWRFINNPSNTTLCKLAFANGQLLGHYALSPCQLLYNNKTLKAALSMSTMTDPDFKGMGIFPKLAMACYQDAENQGIETIFGFPNLHSHAGFKAKLHWFDVERIPSLSMPLLSFKGKKSIDTKEVTAFSAEHVNAYRENNPQFCIRVHKDLAYLHWRYLQNPINKYKIFELTKNGYSYFAVTKAFSSYNTTNTWEIDIVELCFPADVDCLADLIACISESYADTPISQINTWLPMLDEKHSAFEKLGFKLSTPITFFGCRTKEEYVKDFKHSANWQYAMGDSDVY